ncbi:E3 ubiquitin-protein ligase Topor, partial [Stegodyphus mimosarum]
MEKKPHTLRLEDGELIADKSHESTVASSSDENNKESEERKKENISSSKTEEEKSESKSASCDRSSPEPSCAICLEQLQNKSFTDSCFHMFCFKCLVEWSKVKPECPLCKQSFKSIVHNVCSDVEYDQYYIKGSENMWTSFSSGDLRFSYSSAMTAERFDERNRISLEETLDNVIASHRMTYAPHSVRLNSASQTVSPVPSSFRRQIYEEGLWVKPYTGHPMRSASPEFYRLNPMCTHRLLRWLLRELSVLLDNESHVTFVLEVIMALITRYEIRSHDFFLYIVPYFSSHTNHFIHEFYSFAISPFEMETYDRQACYSALDANEVAPDFSSSDNDVIPLSSSSGSKGASSVTTEESNRESRCVNKLVLKRNTENNSWEQVAPPVSLVHNYSSMSDIPCFYSNPGPSTSGFNSSSFRIPNIPESVESPASDDDEVQILSVLKPLKERIPEIIDLLSTDDESKIVVVSSGNESCSDTERGPCVKTPPVVQSSKNIDEPFSNDCANVPWNQPSTSNSYIKENVTDRVESDIHMSGSNNDEPSSSCKKNKSLADIPPTKNKRLKRSSTNVDGSSTESCSGFENSSELNPKVKTLKLRSVVAHFSFDPSDERNSSDHRSSHKRQKEKKKRKKKATHKHHIYSDESD